MPLTMNQVIPNLWIGDLLNALDVENLKAHGIFSILSAMRGRVTIHETFIRHQININDLEDEDILIHFLPSIRFIQAELDKGRGVLVHCGAGISRSATIVAAYLMYSQNIDAETALAMILKVRPIIDPNPGFLRQLEVFHKSRYRISSQEKQVRMFYMERSLEEVMNGDSSPPATDMYAKFPRTLSDSTPSKPVTPRRRIRCKKCRQELAAREHMLDHGQLGPPTPANLSPAVSRRSSQSNPGDPAVSTTEGFGVQRPSLLGLEVTPLSTIDSEAGRDKQSTDALGHPLRDLRLLSQKLEQSSLAPPLEAEESEAIVPNEIDSSTQTDLSGEFEVIGWQPSRIPDTNLGLSTSTSTAEMSAQQQRTRQPTAERPSHSTLVSLIPRPPTVSTSSPPIILNPKCSGYFVEPMKWMEGFLSSGQLAGKIICPKKGCGAKLGNYDWAGVYCGCKQWVTPGFCINRSKVDEIG